MKELNDSSGRSTSVTRKLTAKFAEEWKKSYPKQAK
jgi:FMN-dependent NADH-azoreductase